MPKQASYFAPGKLFLAGEYAVTFPNGEAIILPVKKGIKVTVVEKKNSSITNLQYPKESMKFVWIKDIANAYLRLSIEVVRQWIEAKNIPWKSFEMTIDSSLVSDQGKYGLGSSGALTVSVIGALLHFYDLPFTALDLYKLSVIATIQNYQETSFGDVACSSVGQPIHYQKFSSKMIHDMKTLHVQTLMKMQWDGLLLEPISNMRLKPVVVYSGNAADSHQLVKAVTPFIHKLWVTKSNQLVHALLDNWSLSSIHQLHLHLSELAQRSKVPLYTPSMDAIIMHATSLGGVAKFSGAGGGDCVLVFLPDQQIKPFQSLMKKNNFLILSDII
jgi:phosphomevalonate kinase